MFTKSYLLIISPLLALSISGVVAQDEKTDGKTTPERIDLSNFPGQMVEKIVVPIPAEVFAVLDKVDEPNWASGIQMPNDRQIKERAFLALRFGSLVAEGFIAVQARSSEEIQKIGKEALTLAESLGLANAVRPHSLSIIESAGNSEWEKVREELDSTQQTVRDTMEKLRDDELSGLVSLGGWLRGTNVLTEFIGESFSEDKAELLSQPGLISHFRKMMSEFKGPSKNSKGMKTIITGLARLEAVINQSPTITEDSINELNKITKAMLEEYYFEKTGDESAKNGDSNSAQPTLAPVN